MHETGCIGTYCLCSISVVNPKQDVWDIPLEASGKYAELLKPLWIKFQAGIQNIPGKNKQTKTQDVLKP